MTTVARWQRVEAARHLLARAGAVDVEVEFGRNTEWSATATWPGGEQMSVEGGRTATDAVEGLAAQAYENAICNNCARVVLLAGLHAGFFAAVEAAALGGRTATWCVWKRQEEVWVPGCA